jgi:hypothetical protein
LLEREDQQRPRGTGSRSIRGRGKASGWVPAEAVVYSRSVSLKIWALKPGELKAIDRVELLLLAARCGPRVEPWAGREEMRRCSARDCRRRFRAAARRSRRASPAARDLPRRVPADELREPLGRIDWLAVHRDEDIRVGRRERLNRSPGARARALGLMLLLRIG